jgi:hypothetical protein
MHESAGILPLFAACSEMGSLKRGELNGMVAIFTGRTRSR